MSTHELRFTLNGERREVTVPADRLLIDVLRDDCGATGTKLGCAVGVCGASSVLVDGELQSACLLPAVFSESRSNTTVGGLAEHWVRYPTAVAFIHLSGFHAGFYSTGHLIDSPATNTACPATGHCRT